MTDRDELENPDCPVSPGEAQSPGADLEWRALADSVSAALVYLTADRQVRRANRRARELIGDNPTWDTLVQTEPWRTAGQLVELVESSGVDDFMEAHDGEGGRIWEISASRRPLEDGVVLVLRDVSERVLLEDKLRRKERLMALGNLVDGISHQIRSNLFGLTGLTDVIASHLDDSSELHTYLGLQRRQCGRIVNLLDRLMQFAGKSEPNRTPGELAPVVEAALNEARAHGSSDIEVEVALAHDTPPLVMDRDRLALALSHLLRNAFEHSPETGRITVISRTTHRDGLDWVHLEVDDQGPGLPEKDRDQLFEPFFTRRPSGHGLGLPIARRIVGEHGGRIALDDRPGGGCRVTVSLPVFRRLGNGVDGPTPVASPGPETYSTSQEPQDAARTPR